MQIKAETSVSLFIQRPDELIQQPFMNPAHSLIRDLFTVWMEKLGSVANCQTKAPHVGDSMCGSRQLVDVGSFRFWLPVREVSGTGTDGWQEKASRSHQGG